MAKNPENKNRFYPTFFRVENYLKKKKNNNLCYSSKCFTFYLPGLSPSLLHEFY